jgi:hypothetical protein
MAPPTDGGRASIRVARVAMAGPAMEMRETVRLDAVGLLDQAECHYLQLYHKKIWSVTLYTCSVTFEQIRMYQPSTHSSPFIATSLFQIGTVVLSVSMI